MSAISRMSITATGRPAASSQRASWRMPSSFVRAERPARTSPAVSQIVAAVERAGRGDPVDARELARELRSDGVHFAGAAARAGPGEQRAPADDDRGVLDEGRNRGSGGRRRAG